MLKTLVIYHNVTESIPCRDGLVSAWVAHRALPDADYIGWMYKQNDRKEYPDVKGYSNIFILDFHFPKDVLEQWSKVATIHVIDHHKSTLETLEGFSDRLLDRFQYDVKECGATLSWQYFYGKHSKMPAFLKYIRDRDIWAKELPYTEEIHSAFSKLIWKGDLFRAFETLTELSKMSEEQLLERLVPIGEPLMLARKEKVQGIINRRGVKEIECQGYKALLIDLLKSHEMYRSDIGEYLYRKYPDYNFVVIAKATGGFSIRSDSKGFNFDITKLGAEGHRNAGSIPELKYEVISDLVCE